MAVLADVQKYGINEAARRHGVHQSTVSRWNSKQPVAAGGEAGGTGSSRRRARGLESAKSKKEAARRAKADIPEARTVDVGEEQASSPRRGQPTWKEAEEGKLKKSGVASASAGRRARVAKVYTPSQKAEILEYAAKHTPTEAAKKFGVSRFAVYEWRRKVARAANGEEESPTSGADPKSIEAQRDREILGEWHKHPGLGPSQIKNQLRRRGIKVSVHTTRRVMEEAGYRPPKVKRSAHEERYEAVRPNQMWHLDFVHRHINRASTFTLILIDDYSRFVVGHGVTDVEHANIVIETFEEASQRHGRPESVMNDRGAAFWSWRGISRFTALLTEMGIDQISAEHKEWNGKVEVFNANLHKELFDTHRFYDLAEMRRRLAAHLEWYNHQRTHHALGGLLVPADRYYGRAEKVLAQIEAGGARDPADLLDLRQRALELFKIVTQNGSPEIWLLGQQLFGVKR
jgi:transposase InsO family protein